MNRSPLVPLLALTSVLAAATAFGAGAAKPGFHLGDSRPQIVDAVAYQVDGAVYAEAGGKPGKPVTVVAMADFKIDRQDLIDALNTPNALLAQAQKLGKGNVLLVAMTRPDRCDVTALLQMGEKQFGLIAEPLPVKETATHVKGGCHTTSPQKLFDNSYDFELPYDLDLTVIPPPAKLAAGGGEPGKALVDVVKAIQAKDWKVARLHLRDEEIARNPKPAEQKSFFEGMALNYPKTAQVTGGLIKGDHATVEIVGTDREDHKIRGTFTMKKVGADWRVVDQELYTME